MKIFFYCTALEKVCQFLSGQNKSVIFFNSGEFGIVYKARQGLFKRIVAVKTLKGLQNHISISIKGTSPPPPFLSGEFDQMEVDNFVEESLKMSQFKHAHVMGLIGVCLDAGSAPYIIMPYMANGSLLKWLKHERKNIVLLDETDEDEVIHIFPVCIG